MTLPGAETESIASALALGLRCGRIITTIDTKPHSASVMMSRKTMSPSLLSSPNRSPCDMRLTPLQKRADELRRARREDVVVRVQPDVQHAADQRVAERHRHA